MGITTSLRLAAAAVAALALAGCVRIDSDTSIGADDTFSQHIIVAYTDAVATQIGQQAGIDVGDLIGGLTDSDELRDAQSKYPDQISIEDYAEGDLTGIEVTITDMPLSEFNDAASQLTAGLGATATIEHVGNEFVVTMSSAGLTSGMSGGGPGGLDLDSLGISGGTLMALGNAIDFEVSYTFPGLVVEASAGEIDGNTVILGVNDILSGDDIRLVGGDSVQIDWWPFVKLALVVLAFASVIGGAALLVRQDKRRQRSNSLPPPVAADLPHAPPTDADAPEEQSHPQQ